MGLSVRGPRQGRCRSTVWGSFLNLLLAVLGIPHLMEIFRPLRSFSTFDACLTWCSPVFTASLKPPVTLGLRLLRLRLLSSSSPMLADSVESPNTGHSKWKGGRTHRAKVAGISIEISKVDECASIKGGTWLILWLPGLFCVKGFS